MVIAVMLLLILIIFAWKEGLFLYICLLIHLIYFNHLMLAASSHSSITMVKKSERWCKIAFMLLIKETFYLSILKSIVAHSLNPIYKWIFSRLQFWNLRHRIMMQWFVRSIDISMKTVLELSACWHDQFWFWHSSLLASSKNIQYIMPWKP